MDAPRSAGPRLQSPSRWWSLVGALVVAVATWRLGFAPSGTAEPEPRARADGRDERPQGPGDVGRPRLESGRPVVGEGASSPERSAPADGTAPADPAASQAPLMSRAVVAAKQGRWQVAVKWLEEALATLPPGAQRNRVATLRVHLLLEKAPPVEAALALATLLSDGAAAMADRRFSVADAPDPNQSPEDRTLFTGPFVVAAPASGWVQGGDGFARTMLGHAQDVGGRAAPHLRSQDAYLAYLSPTVGAAIAALPPEGESSRPVLEATRAFIDLDLRIRREGADRVRTHDTAPLRAAVVAFLRTYAGTPDPRVRAFCRFLFQAYPPWASQALAPGPKEG